MKVQHFFDPDTFTLTYLVIDEPTGDTVIIDPVLDFDQASGKISEESLEKVVAFIREHKLTVRAILETHAHADHLSSSQLLKQLFPAAVHGIGEKIKVVQETFKELFNIEDLKTDGSQFDKLIMAHEDVSFGALAMKAIPTPGHTPACMSYLFGEHLFSGDALFMPDSGTGRCDFPKGSAHDLYESIAKRLYALPDSTKVYVGHDYSPGGREMRFQTTIGESKTQNIQLKGHTTEAEFTSFRVARDLTLKAPRLLFPSIQVNIDAGHLPQRESNGMSYLKLPLNPQTKLGKL